MGATTTPRSARGALLTRCVAHLLAVLALAACVAVGTAPALQDAPVPTSAPAVSWPAPQAPFDETPISPVESVGASATD